MPRHELNFHALLRAHHLERQRKFAAIGECRRLHERDTATVAADRLAREAHDGERRRRLEEEALRAVKGLVARLSRGG